MCVSAFLKGLGAGLLTGSMVYMCCAKKRRGGKNLVGRALKGLGAVVEDVADAMGL